MSMFGQIYNNCKSIKPKPVGPRMNPTDVLKLNHEEATALWRVLDHGLTILRSGTREDDDVEVYGDAGISYERLIDALDAIEQKDPNLTTAISVDLKEKKVLIRRGDDTNNLATMLELIKTKIPDDAKVCERWLKLFQGSDGMNGHG